MGRRLVLNVKRAELRLVRVPALPDKRRGLAGIGAASDFSSEGGITIFTNDQVRRSTARLPAAVQKLLRA